MTGHDMAHVHTYTHTHTSHKTIMCTQITMPQAADQACTGNVCTYIHPLPAWNNISSIFQAKISRVLVI